MRRTNIVPVALIGAAVSILLVLGGCAQMTSTERGAVIGAAGGAAVGGAVDRNTARGAIIGAAIGGAAGAVIGRRMDRQADELEGQLPGADVERIGEGIKVTFDSGILFDFDSAQLRAASRDNLRNLARSLERYPGSELLIVGHTDATGSADYNQRLSEQRAQAAANYLVSLGVPRNSIRAIGRGESEPVATNETAAGRQENRRVEIAIFASEEYREQVQREHGR